MSHRVRVGGDQVAIGADYQAERTVEVRLVIVNQSTFARGGGECARAGNRIDRVVVLGRYVEDIRLAIVGQTGGTDD